VKLRFFFVRLARPAFRFVVHHRQPEVTGVVAAVVVVLVIVVRVHLGAAAVVAGKVVVPAAAAAATAVGPGDVLDVSPLTGRPTRPPVVGFGGGTGTARPQHRRTHRQQRDAAAARPGGPWAVRRHRYRSGGKTVPLEKR